MLYGSEKSFSFSHIEMKDCRVFSDLAKYRMCLSFVFPRYAGVEISSYRMVLRNRKYEYAASAKTDEKGEFTLKAYSDSTLLTFSAKGYVDREIKRSRLYSAELGSIELEQAKGMTVALQLSYQEAVREGEESMLQDWYDDMRNITYKVQNVTKNEDVADFAMQQGDIVLPIGAEVGDRIKVTLTSINGKFAEASGEGVIGDDGTATVAIRLVAFGGVEVTVGQKSDDQLLLMLYDDSGKLAGSTTSAGSRVTFSGFEAGGYTLVAMGYNGTVGSIGDLLIDGTDIERYVDVNVVLHETVVMTPKASKPSGSKIEAGYLLWLTSNTPGATIYYTLDGSCPCDEATRLKYTGPFVLPVGAVTVKAIAVRQGMEDSDVATYTYTVEGNEQGIAETKADLRLETTYSDGMLTVSGAEGCTVRVYDMLGRELVSRRNVKGTVSLPVPQAEGYIVSATTKDGQTVVRKTR